MKKRVLWLLAALAALFCLLTVSAGAADVVASGNCGDNLTWTLDSDGVLTIDGTGDMADYNSYSSYAPWYSSRSKITTVVIETGVTSIGDFAFYYCNGLTSVEIGNDVTNIGTCAFMLCGSLTSVEFGEGVTIIENDAFSACYGLTTVLIPDSVVNIGNCAFVNCTSLTSVEIGDNVMYIGYSAFKDCNNLISIVVAKDNPAYASKNGVLLTKNQEKLLKYPAMKKDSTYVIPDSVTNIDDYAFARCNNLTSIVIPDNVESIGEHTFEFSSKLTDVKIGDNTQNIGEGAFAACNSLTSVIIGENVTNIGEYAFAACGSLTSVVIGNNLTSIENGAFDSCDSLSDIYYSGTGEQWTQIVVGDGNKSLRNATIHYNYTPAPTIDTTISFADGVTPTFTVDTDALTGTDNYAIITVGDKTVRLEQAEWVDGKIAYDGIAMKDLTQTVNMAVYDAQGNLMAEQSISVYDALKARLDAETDTAKAALYKAQLHLGAAAQKFFDFNTDNLANKELTDPVGDMSACRKDESLAGGKTPGMICGTSLVLGSDLQMKVYFTANDKTVLVNGEEVELTEADGYFYCLVDIAPEDIFDAVTVEVKDGTETIATGKDSVASYCARLYAAGGEKNQTLADALLNYGVAAKA